MLHKAEFLCAILIHEESGSHGHCTAAFNSEFLNGARDTVHVRCGSSAHTVQLCLHNHKRGVYSLECGQLEAHGAGDQMPIRVCLFALGEPEPPFSGKLVISALQGAQPSRCPRGTSDPPILGSKSLQSDGNPWTTFFSFACGRDVRGRCVSQCHYGAVMSL